jgi:hypothetical protein
MTKEQEFNFIIIYIIIVLICVFLYHFGKNLFINKLDSISDWAYYLSSHKSNVKTYSYNNNM